MMGTLDLCPDHGKTRDANGVDDVSDVHREMVAELKKQVRRRQRCASIGRFQRNALRAACPRRWQSKKKRRAPSHSSRTAHRRRRPARRSDLATSFIQRASCGFAVRSHSKRVIAPPPLESVPACGRSPLGGS